MITNHIHHTDALTGLRDLPDRAIQCCVTSPPYYGLRDYGHPRQIGLEPTPEAYIANLVDVFRQVRRALKDDGTLWINIGDSYANNAKWGGKTGGKHANGLHNASGMGRGKKTTGLKPKDLIGIPWMLAFALRADGWYLRQDIIWHKPNPMPESVTDRCTKAHEYIFLLTKSEKYYYNADVIAETAIYGARGSEFHTGKTGEHQLGRASKKRGEFNGKTNALAGREAFRAITETRNRRSVWTIATRPYPEAHFATYPPELITPCILAGSRPGDIILDPFIGSGTTAEVALRLQRQYIGFEINQDYITLAQKRLQPHTNNLFIHSPISVQ